MEDGEYTARVIGWLRRHTVDVVLTPHVAKRSPVTHETPLAIPAEIVPANLRYPNAHVRLIFQHGMIAAVLPQKLNENSK